MKYVNPPESGSIIVAAHKRKPRNYDEYRALIATALTETGGRGPAPMPITLLVSESQWIWMVEDEHFEHWNSIRPEPIEIDKPLAVSRFTEYLQHLKDRLYGTRVFPVA